VMVLPVGPHHGTQQLVRITKENGAMNEEKLIAVRFVPLLAGKAREL
jgi:protein-L-isoaspartate(D-aspartate) O-methyltransferase